MPETANGDPELERLHSGVPGLDTVLCGGFLQGGIYLILGVPGTGKTILGNQVIFSHAATGGRAIFTTVLGESHARMLAHLRPMSFFDMSRMPSQVTYLSAYQNLEQDGLQGLLNLIRDETMTRGATLLVLDGMTAIQAKAPAEFELKKFVHELQTMASSLDCTMLLLTTGMADAPEKTMVDGLIELKLRLHGVRTERRLLVHKFRGSDFLGGEHAFRITRDGLRIFPRIEAQFALPSARTVPPMLRITSGIESLDRMLGGGLPAATVGAVIGPSGSGKTTLGLHFLAASSASEPGLMFSCYEPPERLRIKAATVGIDLEAAERRGDVEVLWYPVGEHVLDELAARLLEAIERRGVKRLLIDEMSGLEQATLEPDRMVRFWSAMSNELRARGVTVLHTTESPAAVGSDMRMPVDALASLAEVMVVLRFIEVRSRLRRLISLFKVREGAFDTGVREFTIGPKGIVIGEVFEDLEAVPSSQSRESVQTEPGKSGDADEVPFGASG